MLGLAVGRTLRLSASRNGRISLLGGVVVIFLLLCSTFPVFAVVPITFASPNYQTLGGFGTSVAIDGNYMVVGAPGENASGYGGAGHAYVFDVTTNALIATLTSPNAQVGGDFGWSVAISGNTVVVGAWNETVGLGMFANPGAGRAYTFNALTGALIATLTSPNPQEWGAFGVSVAISGTTVVVGAYLETVGANAYAGHAYTFNAMTGALIATLTSPNTQTDGGFGNSVAISGSTLVVGAAYETFGSNADAGRVYLFNAKTDLLMAALLSPNLQADGIFGFSVAVSGSTLVVGAPAETVGGIIAAGRAYIFSTYGSLRATLTSPSSQITGEFGFSVAISGNTVLVGAAHEAEYGYPDAGNAYTFDATTGALSATFFSPNPHVGGHFGLSVGVSGTVEVVGAPQETVSGDGQAGHAYTFNGKALYWIVNLPRYPPQPGGCLGCSVAVFGNTIVAGAPYETVGGNAQAGEAYIFNAKTGDLIANLTSPNSQAGGHFGGSVAISGNMVVVGADGESSPTGLPGVGGAYTFNAKTGALIGVMIDPGPANANEHFGGSVAISGNTVVVGAYNDSVGSVAGAGQAYTFNAKTGDLIKVLVSPTPNGDGMFGASVAISGTTAVVGEPGESSPTGLPSVGGAYTFNARTGALVATLGSPGPMSDGMFGASVAISGNIVVAGEPGGTASSYTGAGDVFTFNAKTGTLVNGWAAPTPNKNGMFGSSVAISGNTVVVGASNETVGAFTSVGAAFVFDSATGAQTAILLWPTPQDGVHFGCSVAISGKIAVVGMDSALQTVSVY